MIILKIIDNPLMSFQIYLSFLKCRNIYQRIDPWSVAS